MKNGNSYKVSACRNETLKDRVIGYLRVYVKKLWVPFLAKLNYIILGKLMLSNLLNFTQDKVFKIFQLNLQLLHFQ